MSCQSTHRVCSTLGSLIGLAVPTTGTYTMEITHLGQLYTNTGNFTAGQFFTTLRNLNENSIAELRIIYNGNYITIDGASTFFLRVIQCFGQTVSQFAAFYQYVESGITGTSFSLEGLVLTNETSTTTLSFPTSGTIYRFAFYKNGAKMTAGDEYSFNSSSGAVTFVMPFDAEDKLIVEATQN